jgi:hypothetical protein
LERFLDGEDVGPKTGAVSSPVEADILRDDEIDGSSPTFSTGVKK